MHALSGVGMAYLVENEYTSVSENLLVHTTQPAKSDCSSDNSGQSFEH